MWTRLEDELHDHPKIAIAGRKIAKRNGRAIALGYYIHALTYCNRHLSDGYLSIAVIEAFYPFVDHPLAVADALVSAGLFDQTEGGFRIHDFADYNLRAIDVKRQRKHARLRKAEYRARKAPGNGAA